MHECPVCGEACGCDDDDLRNDAFESRECLCDREPYERDDDDDAIDDDDDY